MLDIDTNGHVEERIPGVGQESWLDCTLLGAMYPNIHVALVSVPTETLDDVEEATVANAMTTVSHNGIAYNMVGASGSAKNGKYYYCDAAHEPLIAKRFQQWPEAAITYFGILVSGCKVIHTEADVRVMVVKDLELGTNDGRGWMDESLFLKLRLSKGHFYQFRLAFAENLQAKGSFKVMADDVADALGVDIIVPESSIKPSMKMPSNLANFVGLGARHFNGPIVVGIRDLSRPIPFEGSYTVIQHAPEESIELEIAPMAVKKIEALKTAWNEGNHRKVVELIGKEVRQDDNSQGEEFQRLVEALLLADGSGEITRHPYIHALLCRLMARWAYKTTTGGGIELPGFALADDGYLILQNGKVISRADWMPTTAAITTVPSDRGLCVRFPVRMKEDLLPLEHFQGKKLLGSLVSEHGLTEEMAERVVKEQLTLEGTYTLHSKTAERNGGDFDFDLVCVIDSTNFPRFVESRFRMANEYKVTKTKAARAKSPWFSLEFVALKSRGNQIGVITDLMSSCIAAGRHDLHRELVPELQLEIDSLKFNTHADRKKLQAIREQVPPAPWLVLKDAKVINDKEMPRWLNVLPTDLIGKLYNILRKHIEELVEKPAPLQQFRGLIVGNKATEVMFTEARVINNVYRVGHTLIQGKLNQERKARGDAAERMAEAIRSENRQSITEARRAFGKAKARLRHAQEHAREQASSLASIVSSWGDGKAENRSGWCQALHTLVSRGQGNGMGSILFHAYPQEVVESVAARTNGIRTQVRPRGNGVCVEVEGNCLFSVRAGRREFLLRWDRQTDRIVRDAQLDPQSPNVSLPEASICLLPDQEKRSEYAAL
jgi:hypothetical protein